MQSSTTRGLWLDLLPPDIREHIAACATQRNLNRTASRLAAVSPPQRKAVQSVLSERRREDKEFEPPFSEWTQLFGDEVDHIAFPHTYAEGDREFLGSLDTYLTSPKLRSVVVSDHPSILQALERFNVPKVTMKVSTRGVSRGLLASLQRLRAQELHLIVDRRASFHGETDAWTSLTGAGVLSSCRNITALTIRCASRHLAGPDAIWASIASCVSLQQLTIEEDDEYFYFDENVGAHTIPEGNVEVSQEISTFLSRLQSVELMSFRCCEKVSMLSKSFGNAIKTIDLFGSDDISGRQLLELTACYGLKRLDIPIASSAKKVLAQAIAAFPELQALRLDWDGLCWDLEDGEDCDGMVLDAVRCAPKLIELRLIPLAHLSIGAVTNILELLGTRLRCFDVALIYQDPPPVERLIAVAQAAATYNPKLRQFLPIATRNGEFLDAEVCGMYYTDRQRRIRLGNEAVSMLRRLETRAPLLSMNSLIVEIQDWMTTDVE